ncbi:cytochrome b N-terminal domain-containing protein [Hyalangium minutum]|uniref:Menaquinone-cytochrome c reductase, cytochrome B subunit protein n=1 Tax=Hyalangium minutum TaxID=394096 RepID=A0A085WUS7_9BACT|nr:cytochrome b N-terminal domain-containing protein [Hyalangium minutum]KFE71440.1 Menaquinone-cytochrome c reductase, cytochrome B subunit protein [Hyalangium minutum]
MLKRLEAWLDSRTGYRAILHNALHEHVPGGARWRYVFGSVITVLILVQVVTGVALELYYSPSTTDAWASVNYIQTQVWLGSLLRGVHHFGASAIVIVMAMHLMQTAWAGAFRAPREMNWIAGFVLLQIILGLALTGYLLPWDQKGYWATQVATSIAGTLPLIGSKLQMFLQGGTSYGNLTLTRFHTLHVMLLPAALFSVIGIHIALFRKHGVTPPDLPKEELERKAAMFFPDQLLLDTIASIAAVGVIFWLAWRVGAPLEAPADPSSQYLARPEWYFLPLFQLLKYFEGGAELVGTVILPGLAMGFVAALPFLHTALSRRSPSVHRLLAGTLTLGLVGVGGLGALAVRSDRNDPAVAAMAERAHEEALEARRLASMGGVPASGPLNLYRNDPIVWGHRVLTVQCQKCHMACDTTPYKGSPCLEGYGSRAWIARFLRNPRAPHFFGNTKIDDMEPYTGPQESVDALTEFIYSQGGRKDVTEALAKKGEALFDSEGCASCHSLDGVGSGLAPDLKGWASREWTHAFIRTPGHSRFFGEMNEMETFDHLRLPEEELQAVTAWLHAQGAQPLKFP